MTDREELISVNNQLKAITSSVDAYLAGPVIPPGGGGAPSGTIQIPAPLPGGTAQATPTVAGQVYFFVLPKPVGNAAVTKAPGSADYRLQNGLSPTEDAGNWDKLKAIPMHKSTFPAGTVYPYYKSQGTESGGMGWTNVDGGNGVAVVKAGDVYSFSTDIDAILDIQIPL